MSQKNLRVMKNGRRLGGGAAQLSYIKQHGGWDEYHYELTAKITERVYAEIMREQSQPILKIVK